jgi:transcriptional regulator with PAS, ATPase and Fis domain
MSSEYSKQAIRADRTKSPLVVQNGAMAAVIDMTERAAAGDSRVLITGESGVGKDLIARHLHEHSRRHTHAFVAVNCAGLTESVLESELFGHVKGSFTGAYRDKLGKLQLAHRGTLFLDEVGDMSLRMQALLLRFLENGEVQAVGSDGPVARVDVRVVSATNRNLQELVAAGEFREDLLYRLRVIHIDVPPLRERVEDIRLLAQTFIDRTGRAVTISDDTLHALQRYRWPGNVRELQNVVEQIVWVSTGERIEVQHLPAAIRAANQTILPVRERRTQVADELYKALVYSGYSFWDHIYPLFLSRDITRQDMRELVRRGLASTRGNYRTLLKLFGMSPRDYKRFLNFLAAHDCRSDFREFRSGAPETPVVPRLELPELPRERSRSRRQPLATVES